MSRPPAESRARRLTHDRRAHLRAIQISNKRFFAYCEGREHDPYIYSQLISRVSVVSSDLYELYRIEEISGTGGKNDLIEQYKYLKSRNAVLGSFKGKRICCVFFLDKDVDDLRRQLIRSEHVFYTGLYDLEGQVFHDCNLQRAVAIALSIDIQKVPSVYREAHSWIERKAVHWDKWVTLCAFSAMFEVDCGCGYGRPSAINPKHLNSADINAFETFKSGLRRECNFSPEKFERRFLIVQRAVAFHVSKNMLSRLFRGKWLENIISGELSDTFRGQAVNLHAVGPRLLGAAIATFDFTAEWASSHISRLTTLAIISLDSQMDDQI